MTDTTRGTTSPLPSAGAAGMSEWLRIRQDPLAVVESMRAMGDVILFHAGARKSFVFLHPDHVKDILVTNHRKFGLGQAWQEIGRLMGHGLLHSEGEFHKRQRRLMNPVFHHTRIATYAEQMAFFAGRTSERWEGGRELDIHKEMIQLTLGIVLKTVFDVDVERPEAAGIGAAVNATVPLFRLGTPLRTMLRNVPTSYSKNFDEIKAEIDRFIFQMIEERRSDFHNRGDLLSMLLLAQDEEGDGGSMTDQQVRDETVTLLAAGHETTSNALSWTWHLLSLNPEVEAKLHAEVDSVLGGRLPTVEDLPNLPYTRKVLNESMRLYPPAWIMNRRVLEEHEIDGHTLPVDASVLLFPYMVHRDPRFWPDPERFDPDRWNSEADVKRHKFAYFPFGAGPRMCIGESFAWMEAQVIVATLAQRWRLLPKPGHVVKTEPKVNLRPRGGLPMVLEARN